MNINLKTFFRHFQWFVVAAFALLTGCVSESYRNLPKDPNSVVHAYGKVLRYKNDASREYLPHSFTKSEHSNPYHHFEVKVLDPKTPHLTRMIITLWRPQGSVGSWEFDQKLQEIKEPGTFIRFGVTAGLLRGKWDWVTAIMTMENIEVVSPDEIPEK